MISLFKILKEFPELNVKGYLGISINNASTFNNANDYSVIWLNKNLDKKEEL